MRSISKNLFAPILLASSLLSPGVNAAPETSKDPINVVLNDWSSQIVISHIAGSLFEKLGYKVNYVQADAAAQFAGLESGDLNVQVEIWPTVAGERFNASLKTGNVLDMGELGVTAREEWWYPNYMEAACPGLPDWKALLKPECAKAFSNAETSPKGRYLGAPIAWEGFDEERIKALGLPFEVVHAGSDAALIGEVNSAYKRKAPIMAWMWIPHWWPNKMEGKFIQFPPYSKACYEDPSAGINKDMAYDCGKPYGNIHKAAWVGGEKLWPKAYALLKNITIDDATASGFFTQVEQEGKTPEEVAADWIERNRDVWSSWSK